MCTGQWQTWAGVYRNHCAPSALRTRALLHAGLVNNEQSNGTRKNKTSQHVWVDTENWGVCNAQSTVVTVMPRRLTRTGNIIIIIIIISNACHNNDRSFRSGPPRSLNCKKLFLCLFYMVTTQHVFTLINELINWLSEKRKRTVTDHALSGM